MKFNMGCGHNKIGGFINVDLFSTCNPDVQHDLETVPWPWPDNCATEIVFNHSLEHIGAETATFLGIMKELYRICQNDAVIRISVPHPRHDDFITDPSHVRIVTPDMLDLFSRKNNDEWKRIGASNTPFAHYLNVDFELVHTAITPDPDFLGPLQRNEITLDDLVRTAKRQNNVIKQYEMTLRVIKH